MSYCQGCADRDDRLKDLALDIDALGEERAHFRADIDAAVYSLTGAKGVQWPLATLIETAKHYKAERDAMRSSLARIGLLANRDGEGWGAVRDEIREVLVEVQHNGD